MNIDENIQPMKKIILLAVCLLGLWSAKAQYIGTKGGCNYAILSGNVNGDSSANPYHEYYAGLILESPLSKLFSLQVKGIYNRHGVDIRNNTYGKARSTLNYLSAPIPACFNVGRGINLRVGSQLEYHIDKPNFYFDGIDPVTCVKDDVTGMIDEVLTTSIGYATQSGWFLGLRWVQGFTDIFEGNDSLSHTPFGTDYNFKSRTLSAGVGYIF